MIFMQQQLTEHEDHLCNEIIHLYLSRFLSLSGNDETAKDGARLPFLHAVHFLTSMAVRGR